MHSVEGRTSKAHLTVPASLKEMEIGELIPISRRVATVLFRNPSLDARFEILSLPCLRFAFVDIVILE